MAEFERVWEEIQRRAGEELRQLRGNTFTYSVPGNYVDPDRTNQHIPKEHFRRALARAPFPNTAVLQDLRGPSYLYAIVMDERIRPSWDSGANLPEVAASPRVPTTAQYPASAGRPIDVSGLNFEKVADLEPARGSDGNVLEFMPQDRYPGAPTARLNADGHGPFCRFSIPSAWSGAAGVYLIRVDGVIRYVGECADLARRFNLGYGTIQPINCFVGGQPTNCKINNLVLQSAQAGHIPELLFVPSADRKALETHLIAELRPTWNGRQASGARYAQPHGRAGDLMCQ